MQFQYVLLAILATTTQVLAVPTTEAAPATELTSIAEGTRVTSATPKAENEVVADGADTPAEGTTAAIHFPSADSSGARSIASARTTRAVDVHCKGAIQHRVPCYGLED
ncbi:hypothetical protein VE00_05519 [Pseudogymnoascus sp. WSF 3629]|nr:hypothetical protein VE00_05519 [Pseudogymnoascus sp. WSF 3629]